MAKFSPGTMTAVVFAILVGLGGAYTVRQYLEKEPVEEVAETATPPAIIVPVAIRDIESGRKIALTDISIARFATREEFNESPYAKQPFIPNTEFIIGRTLQSDLKQGDVFGPTAMFPEGTGPGIADRLKPGYRAVTVPIQGVGAVAGFATPGAIVDVLFRSTPTEGYPEVTMTLLDRVGILAVDEQSVAGQAATKVKNDDSRSDSLSVTLAVTPDQAKALKVVEGRGTLTMTLRGEDDFSEFTSFDSRQSQHMTLEQLLGMPMMSRRTTMDVWLGGAKQTHVFEERIDVSHESGNLISTPIAAEVPTFVEPGRAPQSIGATIITPTDIEAGGSGS